MRADVIDVSHYQNEIDGFVAAKKMGVLGVIAKATEGVHTVDQTFAKHRLHAEQVGLLFGAYHYLKPGNAKAQADHFLFTVGDVQGLALVCDWEDKNTPISDAQEFVQRVFDKTGGWCVMYSYAALLKEASPLLASTRATFWKKTKLWVAGYHDQVTWPVTIWPRYWLWQFTGDGNGPGPHNVPNVGVNVDISVYSGDPMLLALDWATVGRIKAAPFPTQAEPRPMKPAPGAPPPPEVGISLNERLRQLLHHFVSSR